MITINFFSPGRLTSAMCAGTLIFLSLEHCFSQDTLQITFDGPPSQPRGTQYGVHEYDESGMWFLPYGLGNVLLRNGGGGSFYPDDGTAYLQSQAGIVLGFADGRSFDLLSVDLAEFSTVWSNPITVDFIGYHPDGSTVTAEFTTDGIIDGPGPLADFQTFAFQGFTDVVSVDVPSYPFSMDNLVVAVPEPASGSLLLLGGLSLYVMFVLYHGKCRPSQNEFRKRVPLHLHQISARQVRPVCGCARPPVSPAAFGL